MLSLWLALAPPVEADCYPIFIACDAGMDFAPFDALPLDGTLLMEVHAPVMEAPPYTVLTDDLQELNGVWVPVDGVGQLWAWRAKDPLQLGQEYHLIDDRVGAGSWSFRMVEPLGEADLPSVRLEEAFADVYRDTNNCNLFNPKRRHVGAFVASDDDPLAFEVEIARSDDFSDALRVGAVSPFASLGEHPCGTSLDVSEDGPWFVRARGLSALGEPGEWTEGEEVWFSDGAGCGLGLKPSGLWLLIAAALGRRRRPGLRTAPAAPAG
ncbi:MAG: hypothetical protein H6739_39045 [Alphaproteobacteria bacterium]|nr:hypothetical protein [Alphaproteobacteria bacterium]